MNLCSSGHDEVCYEGRECPACLLKEDRDYFEEESSKWEAKCDEFEKRINELNDRITQLNDKE